MASPDLSFTVTPRGKPLKNLPQEITLPRSANASELYKKIASTAKASVHRVRITKGSDGNLVPNSKEVRLTDTGLMNGSRIAVKDLGTYLILPVHFLMDILPFLHQSTLTLHHPLGPQVSWRTVFVIEYLGPILIHPLIYSLRPYLYSSARDVPASPLQTLSLVLITSHFVKREMETLFLHRFSNDTMPVFNIFRNSAHYWILAGANLAYWVYRPSALNGMGIFKSHPQIASILYYLGLVLYMVGEAGNLNAHLVLRELRREGTKERGIPIGLGFGVCTCPNYMFETVAWVGIALVTGGNLATLVFIAFALYYMGIWAVGKEKRYRREFGDKYKKKKSVMLPGIF